jgi:hypothetical protein
MSAHECGFASNGLPRAVALAQPLNDAGQRASDRHLTGDGTDARNARARSGVGPKLAQERARHSDVRLTMNVYTHAGLYDLAAAVETLPSVLSVASHKQELSKLAQTGTDQGQPVIWNDRA